MSRAHSTRILVLGQVNTYIPDLLERDPRSAEITLRHLLTMTSGLRFECDESNPSSNDFHLLCPGHAGCFIYVYPSADLVLVRHDYDCGGVCWTELLGKIAKAIEAELGR